jgi:uncharacterized membrane protein YfcA
MVPTAISAVLAQHRKRALHVEWVRLLAPGVALGSAIGTKLAGALDGLWITTIFAVYAGFFALKMFRPAPVCADSALPKRPDTGLVRALPQWSIGVLIGGFSALAGVGGASLIVPYLLSRDAGMRQAAAASSAVGLVIAAVGATGFGLAATTGATIGHDGLVGFVCWPAALAIGLAAIVAAPFGVTLAHRVPVARLKQAFAVVLLVVSVAAFARAVA